MDKMDNKSNCRYTIIIALAFTGILVGICILFVPNLLGATSTSNGWNSYGQALNDWLGIFLSAINILVLYDLNARVEKYNNLSSEQYIRAERHTTLAKLKSARLLTFKDKWKNEFDIYVNATGESNEEAYDNFKNVYMEYMNIEILFDKNIVKSEEAKWWKKKFEDLDIIYKTNPFYDVAIDSGELTMNMNKLFVSIAEGVCNPQLES